MRDYQEGIIKFVQIVERYPELYDSTLESYRTRHAELAWDKIAEALKAELGEECTVEEIKSKWKGIRSSFNRCRNKLYHLETGSRKKYYLYDSLKFLEPFTKSKGTSNNVQENFTFEDCGNSGDDNSTRDYFGNEMENWDIIVKSEAEDKTDDVLDTNEDLNTVHEDTNESNINHRNTETITSHTHLLSDSKPRKRKYGDDDGCILNNNEDLHFFKSILPDIKGFSAKEKRKLKIGILKMIDEIEDNRVCIN